MTNLTQHDSKSLLIYHPVKKISQNLLSTIISFNLMCGKSGKRVAANYSTQLPPNNNSKMSKASPKLTANPITGLPAREEELMIATPTYRRLTRRNDTLMGLTKILVVSLLIYSCQSIGLKHEDRREFFTNDDFKQLRDQTKENKNLKNGADEPLLFENQRFRCNISYSRLMSSVTKYGLEDELAEEDRNIINNTKARLSNNSVELELFSAKVNTMSAYQKQKFIYFTIMTSRVYSQVMAKLRALRQDQDAVETLMNQGEFYVLNILVGFQRNYMFLPMYESQLLYRGQALNEQIYQKIYPPNFRTEYRVLVEQTSFTKNEAMADLYIQNGLSRPRDPQKQIMYAIKIYVSNPRMRLVEHLSVHPEEEELLGVCGTTLKVLNVTQSYDAANNIKHMKIHYEQVPNPLYRTNVCQIRYDPSLQETYHELERVRGRLRQVIGVNSVDEFEDLEDKLSGKPTNFIFTAVDNAGKSKAHGRN